MKMLLTLLFHLISWRDWLSQSADTWTPIAQTVQNNPVVISMNVVANVLIAAGCFAIAGMFWYGTLRGKEMTRDLKIWFYLFSAGILMIGVNYLFGIVVYWIPLYWVTALLKLVTGSLLVFAAYLLVGHVKFSLQMPSRAEWEETVKQKIAAEERNRQLDDLLALWEGAVTNRIDRLHAEHGQLSKELKQDGIRDESDAEEIRRKRRARIIETLEMVKKDLKELAEDIKSDINVPK